MVELHTINPKSTDPTVAKAEISRALQRLALRFSKERATLLERIVAYRKAVASN